MYGRHEQRLRLSGPPAPARLGYQLHGAWQAADDVRQRFADLLELPAEPRSEPQLAGWRRGAGSAAVQWQPAMVDGGGAGLDASVRRLFGPCARVRRQPVVPD